jgi:hypothetical protein
MQGQGDSFQNSGITPQPTLVSLNPNLISSNEASPDYNANSSKSVKTSTKAKKSNVISNVNDPVTKSPMKGKPVNSKTSKPPKQDRFSSGSNLTSQTADYVEI